MPSLGSISKIEKDITNRCYKIVYKGGDTAYVNILNDHVIRMYSGLYKDSKYREDAIPDKEDHEAKIYVKSIAEYGLEAYLNSQFDNDSEITTESIKLSFNKEEGTMTITDIRTEEVVLKEANSVAYDPEMDNCTMEFEQKDDEKYFGGGMRPGQFILNGKKWDLWCGDNDAPCPFFWSSYGYGVLRNCFDDGDYYFTGSSVKTTHQNKSSVPDAKIILNVLFFINAKPKDILKDYFEFTGSPALMPEFAFYEGYHRHFGEYNTENHESTKSMVARFDTEDMPLGWVMFKYPDPDKEKESDKEIISNVIQLVDFTKNYNVAVTSFMRSLDKIKEGVAVGILGYFAKDPDTLAGFSATANSLKIIADAFTEPNIRPLIYSKYCWAGTQRYSGHKTTIHGGKWEDIKFNIRTLIGSGLSGQPMVWSEIDGYKEDYDQNVNIREFQWKSFTPFQINAAKKMTMYLKTPFTAGSDAEATKINRAYLQLRSILMPYIYTIAHQTTEGLPMIRAMFLEFPKEEDAWLQENCEHQYMWGPNFLIAPIYEEKRERKIYLPDAHQVWIDFFSGTKHQGGRSITEEFPIWKLPVFVKSGAIIPCTNSHNNPHTNRRDSRMYLIYPDGKTKFTVYEDDGTSLDYKHGSKAETEITVNAPEWNKIGDLEITINKTTGQYTGMVYMRETLVCVMASKGIEPDSLITTLNDTPIEFKETFNVAQLHLFTYAYMLDTELMYNTYFKQLKMEDDITQSFILFRLEELDVSKSTIKIIIKNFENKEDNTNQQNDNQPCTKCMHLRYKKKERKARCSKPHT